MEHGCGLRSKLWFCESSCVCVCVCNERANGHFHWRVLDGL